MVTQPQNSDKLVTQPQNSDKLVTQPQNSDKLVTQPQSSNLPNIHQTDKTYAKHLDLSQEIEQRRAFIQADVEKSLSFSSSVLVSYLCKMLLSDCFS